METVQQNGRFTLFSSKLPSTLYSILYGNMGSYRKYLFYELHCEIIENIKSLSYMGNYREYSIYE